MQIVCSRKDLLAGCQIVGGAVPSRTTMPIYTNIKMIAESGQYTLMATDLEVGVRYEVKDDAALEVRSGGECILNPDKLSAILRESNDATVMIAVEDTKVVVKTSTGEFKMLSESPDGFSDVKGFDAETSFEVLVADLHQMIHRTTFAAAKEEGKYAMRGVSFDLTDGKLRLIATDGKRLAVAVGPDVAKGKTALIPTKALQLLDKLLGEEVSDAKVRLSFDHSMAYFATSKATISTRQVEGRFPSWRDVLPKKFGYSVLLDMAKFSGAVRQAAIMTDEESKRVEFKFEEGKVSLSSQGSTTGKSNVTLAIPYEGEPLGISFDPNYLGDFFRSVGNAAEVKLSMIAHDKPGVFFVGDAYLYLIVPLI